MIGRVLTNIKLWFIYFLYKIGDFYTNLNNNQKLIFFAGILGLIIIISSIIGFIIIGKKNRKKVQYAAADNQNSPLYTAQVPGDTVIEVKESADEIKKTEIISKEEIKEPEKTIKTEPSENIVEKTESKIIDNENEKSMKTKETIKNKFINQVKSDLESEFINLIKRLFPAKINFKEKVPIDEEVVIRCNSILEKLDTLDQDKDFRFGRDYFQSKLIFYYVTGQDNLFERNIKKNIELFPQDDTYLFQAAAFFLYSKDSPDQAEHYLIKAKEINPSNFDIYYLLGEIYFIKNNLHDALDIFKKVILLDPKNSTAHAYKGYILALKGYVSDGEKDLKKAISLNYKDYHSYYFLGNIYKNLEFYGKAAAYYKKAVNYDCPFLELKENYAFSLLKEKKYDMVEKLLEPLHEKKFLSDKGKQLLAEAYENKHNYKKAVELLIEVYTKIKNKEEAMDIELKIGDIYYHNLKNYKEAETYYLHALEKDNDNYQITHNLEYIDYQKSKIRLHNNLGVIYAQSGNYNEAVNEFNKALEIDKDNKDALFNLEKAISFLGKEPKTQPLRS